MKHYEFNNWIQSVKDTFPKFNPTGEILLAAWKEALGDATLDEAKWAVIRYTAENSSRYEPQPKDIKDVMVTIRKNRTVGMTSERLDVSEDYDTKYLRLDEENGDMNWLAPHYTRVLKLIQRDKFPFVQNIYHPTYEEFRECMKRWCQRHYGRWCFCLSRNQIDRMSDDEKKAVENEARAILRGGLTVKTFGGAA